MPETTSDRRPEREAGDAPDGVTERVREVAPGLVALLQEAADARRLRAEVSGGDGASAVCAWNHFENIPTFYNWNNRPR
ncbi:multiple cyclophane-containing RiPP AmcA [Micromonospora sp. GCM10011542]|uniref:multiple cyclophane-containing RiPP AmcA n=1 Tax=Micromonospora sp. GCM10011542 TaxID=3317337 RepID=UPI0036167A37